MIEQLTLLDLPATEASALKSELSAIEDSKLPEQTEPLPPKQLDAPHTPFAIIQAVLACLGEIDLDPCSDPQASSVVPAKKRFFQAEEGLAPAWQGSVYLQPPANDAIRHWVNKLCAEYEAGRVGGAIALLPARVDTDWFDRLGGYPVCFLRQQLSLSGSPNPEPFPAAVFYLGPDLEKFIQSFRKLGRIYAAIDTA